MISLNFAIGIISALGLAGAFGLLWRGINLWYENKVKEKMANDAIQEAVRKGQAQANKPRTDDDVIDRLRRAAKKAD